MKRFFILCALILIAATAQAAETAKQTKTLFHPPQTKAEKVLDNILQDDKRSDVHAFAAGYPSRDHTRDKQFSLLLTKRFVSERTKIEKAAISKSCGGRYPSNGLPCDMMDDIDNFYCAQDFPDVFFYRTIQSSATKVTITYTWPEYAAKPNPRISAHYGMVKNSTGHWQLDRIDCQQ